MELSKEQKIFFDTFGFLKLPGLMQDSIERITEEFEKVFQEHPLGLQHDGTKRTAIVPFIDQREKLSALLDDERIDGILTSLLGDDYNYLAGDGNFYVGDTNWHRDGTHKHSLFLKIAFYLDPVDGSSGALRVIPGSHRFEDQYGSDLGNGSYLNNKLWGMSGEEVPALTLDVKPGDLLVFNHTLFHSSWGGSKRRRMFTINASPNHADHDLEHLVKYIDSHAQNFLIDSLYGEKMVRMASPKRMRHLEQVLANEGNMAALSAAARNKRTERPRG